MRSAWVSSRGSLPSCGRSGGLYTLTRLLEHARVNTHRRSDEVWLHMHAVSQPNRYNSTLANAHRIFSSFTTTAMVQYEALLSHIVRRKCQLEVATRAFSKTGASSPSLVASGGAGYLDVQLSVFGETLRGLHEGGVVVLQGGS